jgi:ribosomal protein S18 acetylase RimI-like enzyme
VKRPDWTDHRSGLTVETAQPEEREAALSLLLSQLAPDERSDEVRHLLESAAAGRLSLDGLLVARDPSYPNRRVAAGFFAIQPGAVAFVWPPAIEGPSYAGPARAILWETGRRLDAAGVCVGQCLLDTDSDRERLALDECGFRRVTELEFLHCSLHGLPPRAMKPTSPPGWTIQPFTPGRDEALFAELLERTTIETADCPELNGLRSGMECLEGHQAAGEYDPALWLSYRAGGVPVAVLLLTVHPDRHAWEIVYLGVLPEARGRGFGRAIVSDALGRARRAGQEGVFLAVDCRNAIARRIYAEAGFSPIGRQAVHLRLKGRTESTAYAPAP